MIYESINTSNNNRNNSNNNSNNNSMILITKFIIKTITVTNSMQYAI